MCNQDFAEKSEPKRNFLSKKLPDLAPMLNKLMQLKRVAEKHSYEIFSDGKRGPGGGAPSSWASFAVWQLKIANLTPF